MCVLGWNTSSVKTGCNSVSWFRTGANIYQGLTTGQTLCKNSVCIFYVILTTILGGRYHSLHYSTDEERCSERLGVFLTYSSPHC